MSIDNIRDLITAIDKVTDEYGSEAFIRNDGKDRYYYDEKVVLEIKDYFPSDDLINEIEDINVNIRDIFVDEYGQLSQDAVKAVNKKGWKIETIEDTNSYATYFLVVFRNPLNKPVGFLF